MNFYDLSIIATLSATFAVVCVYVFLYSLYRQTYIGLWAIFWLVTFGSQFLYRTPLQEMSKPLMIGIQITQVANYVLLVFATCKFLELKMSKSWYYWALVVIVIANIDIYFAPPLLIIGTMPTFIYIAYVYFWHGWMFIHHLDNKGWGKIIIGMAFIGSGLHTLDMPFLLLVKWFVPWGFLISGTFRFIMAIGILMLYVERNFRDLASKEKQYRLLAENAADTIYLYKLKPTQEIEYVTPSINNLTGYSVEEFFETPNLLFSLVHPSDRALINKLIPDPITASSEPVTLRIIRRDHTVVWVEQTTVPILDDKGNCIAFEGIIRDTTARRELEQNVSRLDRLNTVGQMAANMAHEIRNPLTTVQGYLQFYLKKPDFSAYIEQFSLLISELDRANLIIREYLSLCQNKSHDLKSMQLSSVIQDIYPLLKAAANASSKDVLYYPEVTPTVYLDEKEIRQLVLNLVRNALEATKHNGVVTIRTYKKDNDVILAIQDNGTGIPQHILDNIGKPFLTTKENGTGLGLAVVYRIAHDHQAVVQVDSGPQGTTFNIKFKTD